MSSKSLQPQAERFGRLRLGFAARWVRFVGTAEAYSLAAAPWELGAAERERTARASKVELSSLDVAAFLPCVEPTKIVCVGRNYAAHAKELGNELPEEPLIFLKPPSALVADGAAIVLPTKVGEVHHEAELGVVLGSPLSRGASREEALAAVFGLCCANDVTARAIQRKEGKFTRAKGYDSFCPVGPSIVVGEDPLAPRALRGLVNGDLRQQGSTADMVFDVATLLVFIASVMRLVPGDLILTGTPPGVGPLLEGDQVEVEIEGVGTLRNPVAASAE